MIVLKNGLVLEDNQLVKKDILIDGNKIIDVAQDIRFEGEYNIDISKCWVIPGTIDVHAHFREPGYEHKGTVFSESRAAASGGITTAMSMPNLKPTPDCLKNLELENEIIARDSAIRIYPFASVTKGERGVELSDLESLRYRIRGLSDDGVGVNNLPLLKKAMLWAKENDVVISSHAEFEGKGTSAEAEYLAVERELELVKEIGCKYHFCHLSTARSFDAVKKAQQEGLDVTCEVTPHHLTLCEDDINQNTNFKMNPPLRSRSDMFATINALLSGVATMIATDHAPHSEKEKAVEYDNAPNGIIGFETFLPIIYTYFIKTGLASYADFLKWTVYNPAKRFGLLHGEIEKGGLADIAVLDLLTPRQYKKEDIISKAKNSPYIGDTLYGFNLLTIVDGKIVYIRN